jgi:hypothetical protein
MNVTEMGYSLVIDLNTSSAEVRWSHQVQFFLLAQFFLFVIFP